MIPKNEYTIEFSKSSGPGGQNANKVNTKATLKWNYQNSILLYSQAKIRLEKKYLNYINKENQFVISSSKFRTQKQNIEECLNKCLKIIDKVKINPKKRLKTRPTKASIKKRLQSKKLKSLLKQNRSKINY